MAIDTDPVKFYGLIRDAERFRQEHVDNATQLVKRYVGNYYRTKFRAKAVPENMIFSYVANVMPKLVYDNPTVNVKAARSVTHEPVAAALGHALDAWITRVDLRDELELMATDFLFGHAVAKIGLEQRGDYQADPSRGIYEHFNMLALQPYCVRIPPNAFFIDASANSVAEARWMGHQFTRDLSELANDDRYDQAVVATLTGEGNPRFGEREMPMKPKSDNGTDRVSLYEVYLVESKQIGTLCAGSSGSMQWIRPLAEYVGPEDGPYVVFGCYTVPNTLYPLSPICAMAEQFMDLNAHASAAAQEAASHKKLILVDSNQQGLKDSIHSAPTGSVVAIPGLAANAIANVEMGGASPARLGYLEQLRDRLDRVIGFSDAQRGRAAGNTATEATIAAESGDNRTEFINLKFQIGVREAMSRVAWFFFYDTSVVMPVSWDGGDGTPQEGIFLGGIQPGQENMNWVDFALTIDPMSLQRSNPQAEQAKAQAVWGIALQVAPAMVQFPWVNWKALLDMTGQAMNIPDLASRVLSSQGLQMLGQGVLGGMLPGVGPTSAQDAELPANANPQLTAGLQGAPINRQPFGQQGGQPPAAGPNPMQLAGAAAPLNPGVAAFQSLGYGGGAGQNSPPARGRKTA
jgi:hypothetical protein